MKMRNIAIIMCVLVLALTGCKNKEREKTLSMNNMRQLAIQKALVETEGKGIPTLAEVGTAAKIDISNYEITDAWKNSNAPMSAVILIDKRDWDGKKLELHADGSVHAK